MSIIDILVVIYWSLGVHESYAHVTDSHSIEYVLFIFFYLVVRCTLQIVLYLWMYNKWDLHAWRADGVHYIFSFPLVYLNQNSEHTFHLTTPALLRAHIYRWHGINDKTVWTCLHCFIWSCKRQRDTKQLNLRQC